MAKTRKIKWKTMDDNDAAAVRRRRERFGHRVHEYVFSGHNPGWAMRPEIVVAFLEEQAAERRRNEKEVAKIAVEKLVALKHGK